MIKLALAVVLAAATPVAAQSDDKAVFAAAAAIQPKVVAWRRDIHQHPELSNRETRTAAMVADHLRRLGYEVRTGVAKTGVIGVLKGGKPGRVVALRTDMDALPVAEQTGLAFASKDTGTLNGRTVPVMHACGHDAHIAMLMGAAEVFAGMRASIPGTVVLIFQPAEEGPPTGEEGGAPLLIKEGGLAAPKPDAIFGLHVMPGEVGALAWRSGPFMAGSDTWEMTVTGRQTHGAMPWNGVDAASVAASIVTAFNQIAARQMNVAHAPTVLSVGEIRLGSRHNIIPGDFQMTGTLRTFDPSMRKQIMERMATTLKAIGDQYGASAALRWVASNRVTANDPTLAAQMEPTLVRVAGAAGARADVDYVMPSEDFSYYATVAPTLFYHMGIGRDAAPNHSPNFDIDERALAVGVRAHVLTALDFLRGAVAR